MQFQFIANSSKSVRWALRSFFLIRCCEIVTFFLTSSSPGGGYPCWFIFSPSLRSRSFCRATELTVRRKRRSTSRSTYLYRCFERSLRRGSCRCPSWRYWCSIEQLVEDRTSRTHVLCRMLLCLFSPSRLIPSDHHHSRALRRDPFSGGLRVYERSFPTWEREKIH